MTETSQIHLDNLPAKDKAKIPLVCVSMNCPFYLKFKGHKDDQICRKAAEIHRWLAKHQENDPPINLSEVPRGCPNNLDIK